MKKLTAIFAALVLFISASAAGKASGPGDEFLSLFSTAGTTSVSEAEVDETVTKAFKEKFSNAKFVNWSKTAEFYFARFTMDGNMFNSAFREDGSYLAISRSIPFSQLPIVTSQALLKKYRVEKLPAVVTEVCLEGSTDYYLKTDNDTHVMLLKCSPDGNISVFKKTKKKVLVGSVY